MQLQNIRFDTEPNDALIPQEHSGARASKKCLIPLQKETPTGLVDTICSSDVEIGHAGLCK